MKIRKKANVRLTLEWIINEQIIIDGLILD